MVTLSLPSEQRCGDGPCQFDCGELGRPCPPCHLLSPAVTSVTSCHSSMVLPSPLICLWPPLCHSHPCCHLLSPHVTAMASLSPLSLLVTPVTPCHLCRLCHPLSSQSPLTSFVPPGWSVTRSPPHLGGLLVASTALAVTMGTL